jgi:hypothetical protein
MNAGRTPLQRLIQLAVLAVFVVFAFWFLAGPNGLVSIGRRKAHERRIRTDITEYSGRAAGPQATGRKARLLTDPALGGYS